jgi:perosamine synthetase
MRLAIDGGEPVLPASPADWPIQDREILEVLERAWADGSWGRYHGPHNEQLVEFLKRMHRVGFALPCSSGTIAVEIALRGLQIGEADEVVLAGYDFGGNFRAIEAVGARPVLVDIHPKTWCLDIELLEEALSPRTRAVIVSHLHGGLADMQGLQSLRQNRGIDFSIIEDVCQAPGAWLQEQIAGSWGDVAVLSFGGSKLLTAGRGGALLTNREDVVQRAKIYCERGNHAFPLSELQAAVLPPQLEKLVSRNQQRHQSVERLLEQLADVPALRPVQDITAGSVPVYYKLAFHYDGAADPNWPRQRLIATLRAEGVPIDEGFRGFTRRGNQRCRQSGSLTHSATASTSTLLLHHPILLESLEVIDQLAVAIRKVVDCLPRMKHG